MCSCERDDEREIRMKMLLACGLLALGVMCGCSDDEPTKPNPPETPVSQSTDGDEGYIDPDRYRDGPPAVRANAKSLQAALRVLDKDIRSGSIEVRRKALRSILPTKADVQAITPAHAEKLWSKMGPDFDRKVEEVDIAAVELAKDRWREIDAIDIRHDEPWSPRGQAVARVIPEGIPAFRAVKFGDDHTVGSSTYLYINDHWVYLDARDIADIARETAALNKAKDAPKKPEGD